MAVPSERPVTVEGFAARLKVLAPAIVGEKRIAVAVSGGGDSMALTWLLAGWAESHGIELHALTVDHGLRLEAAKEARSVGRRIAGWPGAVRHRILSWTGEKPHTRIQEAARAARYRLLEGYCQARKINYLFLAHHADDQAETILFRLAKGSGLDGLAGMKPVQIYNQKLTLVRPLLDYSHNQLISTCIKHGIEWVEDKSNVSDRYARVRLRKTAQSLGREGLTSNRLVKLGKRMERARSALEQLAENEWINSVVINDKSRIVLNLDRLFFLPEELTLRLISRGITQIGPRKNYAPSLERLDEIVAQISNRESTFRAATLGGCVVRRSKSRNTLTIEREGAGGSA